MIDYSNSNTGFSGPRPTTLTVKTNYFPLEFDKNSEWIQYRVEVVSAIRKKNVDDEKKFLDFEVIANPQKDRPIDIERGSELSRRILRQLNQDLGNKFTFDGSNTAYSPSEFFEGDTKTFKVKVKRDCDQGEKDGDLLVKNEYFLVNFSKPIKILTSSLSDLEPVRRAMDIIMKSAMVTIGMKAFGRNPRAFYFPEEMQPEVVNSNLLSRMMQNVSYNRYILQMKLYKCTHSFLDHI